MPATARRDPGDTRRIREVAAQLYDGLKIAAKKGGGVDISRGDQELAAAVMYLLKKNPQKLTVVKNARTLTLAFRQNLMAGVSPGLVAHMEASGCIASPGEDLSDG